MTRERKCNSESNSFVAAAAEQVRLQPAVLEHRQRRGRRHTVELAVRCGLWARWVLWPGWSRCRCAEMKSVSISCPAGGLPYDVLGPREGAQCRWLRRHLGRFFGGRFILLLRRPKGRFLQAETQCDAESYNK